MATQSLYRRYRPRRFAELKGQDHVVRALRDAVRSGREGQAYLFSGPRGTGKTSSARILAKVLNCKAPVDGEPCCECDSCLAVERGTSYDVHELDAASNNGVDAIRDLIEKASLGTPGRHKVYILDEVHMLSKAAEAALLKTLEEPPPHVVFVLATTDPQKMSDTIRSRTQHLQFHLLASDTLTEHVRWVAADAGLDLSDEAFDAVISQGGGSARDTLSALELMAATGGDTSDQVDFEVFVRALIDRDVGQALTAVAHAVRAGHEPRTLTEALVRHLRDGFLSLMAPDLVLLPRQRVDQIAESAQELGAAALVRAIERLGSALVEMRHAPDPRVLLEVALVVLTHDEVAHDLGSVIARIERLEQSGVSSLRDAGGPATKPPVDPTTGRAVLGGRARRTASSTASSTASAPASAPDDSPVPADSADSTPAPPTPAPADAPEPPGVAPGTAPGESPTSTAPSAASTPSVPPAELWETAVRPALKPFVRALYSAGAFTRHDPDTWYFAVPNAAHGNKCESHRAAVEAAISAAAGSPVRIVISVGGQLPSSDDDLTPASARAPGSAATSTAPGSAGETGRSSREADTDADENDIDLDELVDAPPESVLSPVDRLAQAFPGAELVDDA